MSSGKTSFNLNKLILFNLINLFFTKKIIQNQDKIIYVHVSLSMFWNFIFLYKLYKDTMKIDYIMN